MRGVRSLRLVLLGVCLLIASAQEETDCSSHIQEMTTLKKLADALKTKTAGLSDKLAECKSVASALRSEKDDVADQLAALNEAHAPVEEELNLVRKELSITQERLEVSTANVKAHQAREHTCMQDLELQKATAEAAERRATEAQETLRRNDCTSARQELRAFRDKAENLEVDKQMLVKKVEELEGRAAKTTHYEQLASEGARARIAAEVALKAKASELEATQKALNSLLASLDTKQQYEALLKEHQKEWLPHWLGERMAAAQAAAVSAGSAVTSSAATIYSAGSQRVSALAHSVQVAGVKLWELRIRPVVTHLDWMLYRHGGAAWPAFRRTSSAVASAVLGAAQRATGAAISLVLKAEGAAEQTAMARLQRTASFKQYAHHDFVHIMLWGLVAALLGPPAAFLLLRLLRALWSAVRPGRAQVVPPVIGSAMNSVEEKFGYRFEQADALKAAFVDDKSRLSWMGEVVLQLLVAEEVQRKAAPGDGVAQLDKAVYDVLTPAMLAAAARRAGLEEHVRAGPGARSKGVVQMKLASLYTALMGAAYTDADGDMKAVRTAWARGAPGGA